MYFILGLVYSPYMNKSTIIGIVVLLAALAGIVYLASVPPTPAKAPGTTSILPVSGAYAEHAAYYDIAANYPTTTPLRSTVSTASDDAAITLVQGGVKQVIDQFKADGKFDQLTAEDIKMMGFDQGRKETLQINYLIASSPRTGSYIFTIYMDTLGAHPNGFFKTYTFDATTGAPLALKDLFAPGTDYLGMLSSQARAKLPEVMGKQFADAAYIKEGTTPEEKNFSNFFFDNADFVVLFPPYQVAAYAAGPQTLRIPVAQIRDLLKPEYRQQ